MNNQVKELRKRIESNDMHKYIFNDSELAALITRYGTKIDVYHVIKRHSRFQYKFEKLEGVVY